MIDLRRIHEREVFDLLGGREFSLADIRPSLVNTGFVFMDDVALLKRADRVEQWQTKTLLQCEFLLQGKEVYPGESGFDHLRLSILVASLPEEQVVKALQVIFDVADQVRLNVSHSSRVVSRVEIPSLMAGWAKDILGETGDVCGSESAAILIAMKYDKRRP